jgi:radical SAM protein with 4Fe4S-binding SPASM domain
LTTQKTIKNKYIKKIKILLDFYRVAGISKSISLYFDKSQHTKNYYIKQTIGLISLLENEFKFHLKDHRNLESKSVPEALRLETTNTCNLNCPMCDTGSSTREKGFMSTKLFEDSMIQAKAMGIKKASLHTIGEPFVYPKMTELVGIAENHNFVLKARSNGVLTKRIKSTYKKYSPSLPKVTLSIDSADKSTYEKIREGAKFEELINSLEEIKRINKTRSNNKKMTIHNKVVISSDNIFGIKDIFSFYEPYIEPHNHVFNLANNMGLNKNFFSNKQDFKNLFVPMVPCNAVMNTLNILHDGRVSACQCREYNGDFIIGDLKENSLQEIYFGENVEKMREKHRTGKNLHPTCQNCKTMNASIKQIINIYIQYLRVSKPNLSSRQFGDHLVSFLSDLDDGVKMRSVNKFRNIVAKYFL